MTRTRLIKIIEEGDLLVKKIARLLLLLTAILSLSACGTQEVTKELPQELIKPNTTVFSGDEEVYKTVVENEFLKLSYCETSAQFRVINKKDGSEFQTVTSEPAINAEKSLFEIQYMDDKNNFSRMYSYSDSVEKGQYQTEPVENGIKIGFTLGEVEQNVFCPPAIAKERFEAIVEKVGKQFDKIRFKQSYFLPDLEKVSPEKKADLLKKYPTLETEALYVLVQNNLPSSMQKEISRILEETGYTEEDYAIDMQSANELEGGTNVIFHLNMYITLEDDELKVRIPVEEMIEVNGGKILTLSLLKNFASPEYGEKGQFLLPDGSGSLMSFYNGKGDLTPFRVPIYGADKAIPVQEQIFRPEHAYLPIYAVQYEDKAMLGMISDGEAFAEMHASPGSDISHAAAYPVFNLRQSAKAYLQGSQDGAEAFTLLQKQLYDGDLAVTYHFFDEESSKLGDIASYYSNELFGDKKAREEDEFIYLEFIGATYNEEGEYSLGGGELETFTTIIQAREIVEDLVKEGVQPLSVRLLGFGENGLDCTGTKPFELNKDLGTYGELEDFMIWAKENGVELYIDVDPQYVHRTGLFDSFSKTKHTTYMINNKYGQKYPYWPNTLQMNALEKSSYILNPSTVSRVIAENNKAIQAIGGEGISFRDLGSTINSDFRKKRPIDRQNAMKLLVQDVQSISNDQDILINGANAPLLPYVSHVNRVAVDKAQFDIADHSIAFLQMVLSDRVGYSDIPVNLSSNTDKFMMNSIGIGAGFTYVLTGEPNKTLRKTTHSEYYSTAYETWKEDILEKAAGLKERRQYVTGAITEYEILAEDVYKVVYSDGGWIVCNGSELPYFYSNKTLQPYTYLMGGARDDR